MTELEGPPKPPARPEQRILTPEEERALATQELAKMEMRLVSALLPKDKSVAPSEALPDLVSSPVAGTDVPTRMTLPDSDPALSLHPAPQPVVLSATALNIPKDDTPSDDKPASNPLDGPVLTQRRRKNQVDPKLTPATSSVLPPTTVDAIVTTATVDKKDPVIVLGRYRDHKGVLCDVREENDVYYYTPIEGEDKGEEFSMPADKIQDLVVDWEKVDDATLPTIDTTVTPDPVVLSQTPDPIPVPDATVVNTPVANIEAGKKKITVRELLKQVPDGGIITVKDKSGTTSFRRKGDGFETTAKRPADANKILIRTLTHGGAIVSIDGVSVTLDKAKKPDNTPVTPKVPDVAPVPNVADPVPVAPVVPPVAPLAPATPPVAASAPAPAVTPPASPAPAPVKMSPTSPDATFDASKKRIKLPENPGEILYYETSNGQIAVQFESSIGRYVFASVDVDMTPDELLMAMQWAVALGNEKTQDEILLMAKDQKWKQIDAPIMAPKAPDTMPVLNDVVTPGDSKKEGLLGFQPLKDGERAHYFVSGTNETVIVERAGDTYTLPEDIFSDIVYSEEEIINMAETGGWQFFAEGLRPEDFAQKTSREVSAEEDEKKIKDLRDLMEMMRLEYVSTDYNEKSKWPLLKRIFGKGISDQPNSQATQEAYERYTLALTRLKDAEIALLKKEKNLTPAELRGRMGQMIHFYDRQAVIDLALTRDQVKIENRNFPQKVVSVAEEIGRRYNQLSRKQKFLIGGLCAGVGIATGAVGGAMAAGSIVFARRLLTTAGLAVTADTYLEGRQEKKQAEEFEVQKNKQLDILDIVGEKGTDGVYMELERLLNDKMATLDAQFQTHKKQEGKRRVLAWGGATLVSFAGGAAVSGLMKEVVPDTSDYIDRIRRYNAMYPGGETASAVGGGGNPVSQVPGGGVSGGSFNDILSPNGPKPMDTLNLPDMTGVRPEDIITPGAGVADGVTSASEKFTFTEPAFLGNPSLGIPGDALDQSSTMVSPLGETSTPTASLESVTSGMMSREDYTVTSADSKKGLWGILEKRLPEGIRPEDHNRVITSLENLMRKDLATMSPAERAVAGFAEGKIDIIHKGDVIQFDKFPSLTPERIQAIIDGQSVGTPSASMVGEAMTVDVASDTPLVEGGIPVSPMDHALAEEKITRLADQPMVASDPAVAVQEASVGDKVNTAGMGPETGAPVRSMAEVEIASPSPMELTNPARLATYMTEHPELTRSYQQTLRGIKTDIFSMGPDMIPENGPYMARIDGGYQPGIHGGVYMDRVLETHRDLRTGEISPFEYDRRDFPFKSTQVDRLAHLVRTACHPKIFGEAGRVLDGEKVDQYLKRIATLATISNKEREVAFLVSGGKRIII